DGRPTSRRNSTSASAIGRGRGSVPAASWRKWNGMRASCSLRVGFIVTNLKWSTKRVVRFYNRSGTAEQWIKEGKNAVKWTKLSCRRFKDNEPRLQLFVLAYNLANFLRQLVLPRSIRGWTLTTLREKLFLCCLMPIQRSRAAALVPKMTCQRVGDESADVR